MPKEKYASVDVFLKAVCDNIGKRKISNSGLKGLQRNNNSWIVFNSCNMGANNSGLRGKGSNSICGDALSGTNNGAKSTTLPSTRTSKSLHYCINAASFVFSFKKAFPILDCKMFLQEVLSFVVIRHDRFEEVNHNEVKKNLRLKDGGRLVDLLKHDAKEGLYKHAIVTVNGLVNMDEDEISMRVESGCPFLGVSGPEGEYGKHIGDSDSFSSWKSRYGDQAVGMDMNRYLRNKGEHDTSQVEYKAIKKGDVITMVVKNHTLTYYHNNVRIGPFKKFKHITLLKNREYKFAVELKNMASVHIVE